jgi:hypothetical protein
MLGAAALGVRLPQALQGVQAGRLVDQGPPHDAGAGGADPAVPARRDHPSRRGELAHVQLRHRLGELERRGHEQRGDEHVAIVAIEPQRRVEDGIGELHERHGDWCDVTVSRRDGVTQADNQGAPDPN